MRLSVLIALGLLFSLGCSAPKPKPPPKPEGPPPGMISILQYEKKAGELVNATQKLETLRNDIDEQRRRLMRICTDYPDHDVCKPQTEAEYARKAFCNDAEFTTHVDQIVSACHQGQCKQVDQASLLTRSQYMMLVQRLPHALVTFGAADTHLDTSDRRMLQQFIETIRAEKGYMIIVGRASKDGPWRKNLRYALERAEGTREFLVKEMGVDPKKVGYITYGHEKMYLTGLDAERLSTRKLSQRQANRSALIFTYPCFKGEDSAH